MQRITIEGFLIQYDPLHPMQYKDPLHPWVGSSASTGCGKKEGWGIYEIKLGTLSNSKVVIVVLKMEWNGVFGLQILKSAIEPFQPQWLRM